MSRCLSCLRVLTWDEQKRQFGKLLKKKYFSVEEAKAMMPRCQKCVTVELKARKT